MDISKVVEVPLKDITLQGVNVRSDLTSENSQLHLNELAESIKVNGLMQPIVLKGIEGQPPYDVVVGQRRFMAHQLLGKETILATFTGEIDEYEALALSLSENLLRQELNHSDIMDAVTKLYIHFGRDEYKVKEKLGLSIKTIRSYLKIQEYATDKIKQMLFEGKINPTDAKRAIDAAQGDMSKADRMIDELAKMTKHQKIRAVEYGKSNQSATAEQITKFAKTPKLEETLILNLSPKVKKALEKAAEKTNLDAEVIVISALKDWLAVNDFLVE